MNYNYMYRRVYRYVIKWKLELGVVVNIVGLLHINIKD